jgi:hypothetical protein
MQNLAGEQNLKVERCLNRHGYSPFAHQPSEIDAAESHPPGSVLSTTDPLGRGCWLGSMMPKNL